MSVCVSGVSMCQWVQYVLVVSVSVSRCQNVSVVSVCVSGFSMYQLYQYVSVVLVGISGVGL